MDSDGIRVELDELTEQLIKGHTKREIARMLAEKWVEKHGEAAIEVISIDRVELKNLVLDRLVDEIIEQWKEGRK